MPPSSSEVLPFNLSHRRSAVYPWLRSNGKGHRWSAEPGRGKGQGAERLPAGRPGIPLEPHLAAYAERLVEAGKAPSVSAVVNDALEARQQRDLKARRLWREAAERADPDQIARMLAHVEAQAAQLPASHRYR